MTSSSESPDVPGNGVIEGAATSPSAADENKTTDSSPGGKGVETSVLDAVKTALQGGSEKSPISESGEGKPSPKPDTDPAEPPDLSEQEIKQLHPKTQARMRFLAEKAKDLSEKTTGLESEVSVLKPKAEKLDTILSYMDKHNIEPQEFDSSLEITRLIKSGNYSKALEALTPIYRELASRAGEILPADLQEQIRLGYITEQHARDLHKSRTALKNTEAQTADQKRREEAQRVQGEIKRTIDTSVQAADKWAKAKATADPDWHLKQDLVAEQVEIDTRRRQDRGDKDWFPSTAEETVKRAEDALEVVEKRLRKMAPKPVAKTVVTSQPASPRSAAKPTSSLEAIKQALNG